MKQGFIFFVLIFLGFALMQCQRRKSTPAKIQGMPTNLKIDLARELQDFKQHLVSTEFSNQSCERYFNLVYQDLFLRQAGDFAAQAFVTQTESIIKDLWASRLEVRRVLKKFYANGTLSAGCVEAVRRISRAGRFMEDFLGEWHLKYPQFDKDNMVPVMAGEAPYLLLNPKYEGFNIDKDLKSGDIILTRGNAFASAAIARLGDEDTQFSHLTLVYIDPKTNEKFTIEAHIEVGVVVAPFKKHLAEGNVRAVLYRYHNAELAHQAATIMYDRASKAMAKGQNIPYDFKMKLFDHSELFCSEVITQGYQLASKDHFIIPKYPTTFTMKNRWFHEQLGILETESFQPADMEVDPRFDMILEWRDFTRTRENRMQDVILTKLFEWMEQRNYKMKTAIPTKILAETLAQTRRWPIFRKVLEKKLPKNMDGKVIATTLNINKLAGILMEQLEKENDVKFGKSGYHLSSAEMSEYLEHLRILDEEKFNKKAANQFHYMFNAN